MKNAPQTLTEALDVIRAMHGDLLGFRHPEFDLIAPGREGEFDDRVKAVLAHSAPVIKADRCIEVQDVVRLNSGGPNMLVRNIKDGLCDCHWLDDDGVPRSVLFLDSTLTVVKKGCRLPEASPATKGQCNEMMEHRRSLERAAMSELTSSVALGDRDAHLVGGKLRVAIDALLGWGVRPAPSSIHLTPAEIQSGLDRVRWAESLIKQLPEDHEGRNSWLLNYGGKTESA